MMGFFAVTMAEMGYLGSNLHDKLPARASPRDYR